MSMLDETKTPGQTLCVFCRMEERPTIWSVVDSVLNTDDLDTAETDQHLIENDHMAAYTDGGAVDDDTNEPRRQ